MSDVLPRRVIEDVATLKALADPIRMAILEAAMGEPNRTWTAKEFAGLVGIPPTKIYYHLNQLEKHDLVQIRDTRVVNGIIEKQYGAGQLDLTFTRRTDEDDDAGGLRAVVAAQLNRVRDDIDEGLSSGTMSGSADSPLHERMLVSNASASISEQQVGEFREALLELIQRFEKKGSGDHRFTMLVALHPSLRQ
ncbi:winged helix-turn-helix domain-containing protein [Hamadaea tsunoensis]|uniref:winged helix-turn-helix domain-containing protein n=1 Tax=Hamadaea tsunoensis TaxID=53368 RepID=UPI00042892C0|nr:helix-turn-helix domain-containing protein [Hamadaea tsunoensis]